MIIMTLAYSQHASDTAYLKQHYSILKQWTSFLIAEALIPANQLSTDDFQGSLANQTNLALKGIIAIQAMSVIANVTGNSGDALNYTKTAHDYLTQWETMAVVPATSAVPAHTKLAYQDPTGHGLLYNLYADTLLKLNFVPKRIYDMQSAYYPTIANVYGVQLDSRNVGTKCKFPTAKSSRSKTQSLTIYVKKADWEMWTAAISSPSTKFMFISKLAKWIGTTPTTRAFTDLYNTQTSE